MKPAWGVGMGKSSSLAGATILFYGMSGGTASDGKTAMGWIMGHFFPPCQKVGAGSCYLPPADVPVVDPTHVMESSGTRGGHCASKKGRGGRCASRHRHASTVSHFTGDAEGVSRRAPGAPRTKLPAAAAAFRTPRAPCPRSPCGGGA